MLWLSYGKELGDDVMPIEVVQQRLFVSYSAEVLS